MKQIKTLLAITILSFSLFSCTKDIENSDEDVNFLAQIETSIKNQVPNKAYDTEPNGIYHGIIASGETTSRGKIWINLGNNGLYNAIIEMIDGDVFDFVLNNNNNQLTTPTEFEFIGSAGEFKVDVSDIDSPLVTDVVLNNQPFFSSVVKNRNIMAALSFTGTFSDPVNTSFTGTWNILSDGSITNPNNDYPSSQAITSVVVTYNGVMYTDTAMETFNSSTCLGGEFYIPNIGAHHVSSIFAGSQNSEFGGTTSWTLGVHPGYPDGYLNPLDCSTPTSGIFSWAHPTNGLTRSGSILID